MLHVETLTARAGKFWLRDVSLAVSEGEIHAVLGPSGSGKTTLLNAVLGLQPPTQGRIRLNGADITDSPVERRGLGYVPQQLGLFPHMTVRDNLAYSARARGVSAGDYQPLVARLADATGIGAILDRLPMTLSGGEKQRVGLVRALACRPRLVLLDEPFCALNESLRRELWDVLHGLRDQYRMTALLVTHSLEEAHFLSDRISVLLDGRIVQQGETEEVFAKPVSLAVGKFLGVENLLPAEVMEARASHTALAVGHVRLVSRSHVPKGAGRVLVSIRSENVQVSRLAAGESDSGLNRLPARVVSVRPCCRHVEVGLHVGALLVAAVTRAACGHMTLRPGDEVTALVDPADVHVMAAEAQEKGVSSCLT